MYTLPTLIGLVGLAAVVNAGGPDTTCTDETPTAPPYSVPSSSEPPTGPYVPSSSSEPPTGPYVPSSSYVPSVSASAAVPSSTPSCWTSCFQQAGITSEADLCGNTEVDQCIQDDCSSAEDQAYWSWYDSYCGSTSSSVVVVSSTSPASPTTPITTVTSTIPSVSASATPDCWSQCFAEAGITSESELCGNTEVDQCIQDNCSAAQDQAYWAWYDSFCPATSSGVPSTPSSSPVGPVTTASSTIPTSPSSTPDCWSACFAQAGISSESELCGNTAVDSCIQSTCSSASDEAYWAWYNSFCPAVSTLVTITSTIPCTTGPGAPVTTTYTTVPGAPAGSSPVSPVGSTPAGAPPAYSSPASPVGSSPAGGSPAPYSSPASPVGTAASSGWGAQPSASGYPVVPSTGEGVVNKPGVLIAAAVLGFAALL